MFSMTRVDKTNHSNHLIKRIMVRTMYSKAIAHHTSRASA